MRCLVGAGLFVVTLACGSTTDTAPAEGAPRQVAGEWTKADDLLPPVELALRQEGAAVDARLRLSGVEARGSGTVTESGLSITFPGRARPLTAVFESDARMRARLGPSSSDVVVLVRKP